jgi:two-component system response regulator
VDILLIEDNPADVLLFREALKAGAIAGEVTVLRDGNEVAAFLRPERAAARTPPQLIVVDLGVPGMALEELMAALRCLPAYQPIPVLVFSAFPEREGHERSAQCGATAFVPKPGELEAYLTAVQTMVQRWGRQDGSSHPDGNREGESA